MALSAAGLLAIAGYEGFSDTAYEPLPGDRLTIGFGHTDGVQAGGRISLEQGLYLLRRDAQIYEHAVNNLVTVPLTQNQFDALVSLVYNIGITAFSGSSLLQCLNAGNLQCVRQQWMRWIYFKGKPIEGLKERRKRELAVFNGEKLEVDSSGCVCFGSAGCLPFRDALQAAMREPDGANFG